MNAAAIPPAYSGYRQSCRWRSTSSQMPSVGLSSPLLRLCKCLPSLWRSRWILHWRVGSCRARARCCRATWMSTCAAWISIESRCHTTPSYDAECAHQWMQCQSRMSTLLPPPKPQPPLAATTSSAPARHQKLWEASRLAEPVKRLRVSYYAFFGLDPSASRSNIRVSHPDKCAQTRDPRRWMSEKAARTW